MSHITFTSTSAIFLIWNNTSHYYFPIPLPTCFADWISCLYFNIFTFSVILFVLFYCLFLYCLFYCDGTSGSKSVAVCHRIAIMCTHHFPVHSNDVANEGALLERGEVPVRSPVGQGSLWTAGHRSGRPAASIEDGRAAHMTIHRWAVGYWRDVCREKTPQLHTKSLLQTKTWQGMTHWAK